MPVVSRLNPINIGSNVPEFRKNNLRAEGRAVKGSNEGIRLAVEVGDNGTRELLHSILKDQEEQVDWLKGRLDQMEQIGIALYLSKQMGEKRVRWRSGPTSPKKVRTPPAAHRTSRGRFLRPSGTECGIRADTIVPPFPEGRCSAAENSDGGRNERFRRQGEGEQHVAPVSRGRCRHGR